MDQPTLTLAATVITLPFPSWSAPPTRTYNQNMIQRDTIGGLTRITVMSKKYNYMFAFQFADLSLYDSIIAMWEQAVQSGTYPTFNYVDAYPTADDVQVWLDISATTAAIPGPDTVSTVHFTLGINEVVPR